MAKKSNIKELIKEETSKKPAKKSIKKKKRNFDFTAHNKMIAKKRGDTWKKKLVERKLEVANSMSFIRKHRVLRGISQVRLLKLTSLKSLTSIRKIEYGTRTASFKVAVEIAKALGVQTKVLFTQVDKTGKARYKTKMV